MIHDITKHHELIASLVRRELKSRYKGSVLGVLWSILTPLFMAGIYAFFMQFLLRVKAVSPEGIIVGVFAWTWTVYALNTGMLSVSGNSNLVKKVKFPRHLLPCAVTLSGMVDYLIAFLIQVALILILIIRHGGFETISPWQYGLGFLLIPIVVLYHAFFNYGIAMITSAANVYFRDTQHFVGVATTAWFFTSPIMFSMVFIQDRLSEAGPRFAPLFHLFELNPLAVIIGAYRSILLPRHHFAGPNFSWNQWDTIGLILPIVFTCIAYVIFQRAQRNFADYL
jgi:lipopolysaccharide transport system permease protein